MGWAAAGVEFIMGDYSNSALEIRNKGQKYASFFERPDRHVKELGVVKELLTTLNNTTQYY